MDYEAALLNVVKVLPASVAQDIAFVLAKNAYFGYGALMLQYADAIVRPAGLPENSLQARLQAEHYAPAGKS